VREGRDCYHSYPYSAKLAARPLGENMALDLNITNEIVERLKHLDPKKIILFGSLAYGVSNKDSDIDLYVVTKDEYIPSIWREHSEIFLQYVKQLNELYQNHSIDLIVHTHPMFKKFIEMDGMFCKKILRDGVTIYESND